MIKTDQTRFQSVLDIFYNECAIHPTPLGVGWIAQNNQEMCKQQLILYTYSSIIYVWKIIIDIQIQPYL